MFRSLHMKLVLIMLLLITSLMAVVGAFLMTSVTNFFIDDFYSQMGETFGESNADFVNSLRAEAAQEGGVDYRRSAFLAQGSAWTHVKPGQDTDGPRFPRSSKMRLASPAFGAASS